MSRGPKRSYDPEHVLDRVMRAFWRRGYSATSMRELREATGLGSRSLYDDFGNKRALFRAALVRYREEKILSLYAPLREGESPLIALREFIARFETHSRSDIRLGCLVGIGMAESIRGEDPVLANEIAALADEMRELIKEAIRSAVERGELDGTIDPPELAALLFATLQGANLLGRVQPGGALRADALSAAQGLLDRFANATESGSLEPR